MGPRLAGDRPLFGSDSGGASTSESSRSADAGVEPASRAGSQDRASDRPGNGEPARRPSRSTTVAGMSRRLAGSRTTRPGGTAGGETISKGTWTSGR